MATVYLRKNHKNIGLTPADRDSEAIISKLSRGELLKCKISQPRNLAFHCLYFALLKVVMDNLPEEYEKYFPTTEILLDDIKMGTGRFTTRISPATGKEYHVPDSISFEKMDNGKFEEFFEDSMRYLAKKYLYGVDPRDLEENARMEMSNYA